MITFENLKNNIDPGDDLDIYSVYADLRIQIGSMDRIYESVSGLDTTLNLMRFLVRVVLLGEACRYKFGFTEYDEYWFFSRSQNGKFISIEYTSREMPLTQLGEVEVDNFQSEVIRECHKVFSLVYNVAPNRIWSLDYDLLLNWVELFASSKGGSIEDGCIIV